jgi:NAD+ synthase
MSYALPDLLLDAEVVRRGLCSFIAQNLEAAGRQRAVLGLSGGLDSSLVCWLAKEALGPENVVAVTMPYWASSPDSLEDALAVIHLTGVKHVHIDISRAAEAMFAFFPAADRRRRGNILARLRMIVLYDCSEEFEGLVLGTGNKTELLLGYFTLHGDSACALMPIGDLYKTQVRQLASALGIPDRIIKKPPTADLWPGQTDEGEIGLLYDEADAILYELVELDRHPAELVAAGWPAAKVERVCNLMRASQFKRVLPPIAKVNRRTLGRELPPERGQLWPFSW